MLSYYIRSILTSDVDSVYHVIAECTPEMVDLEQVEENRLTDVDAFIEWTIMLPT